MDEREQQRKTRHRLEIIHHAEEVTGNVAATCCYYGISQPCFYKWLWRYEEFGEEGLRDGSSPPLNNPWATKPEVVSKIIYPGQQHHFGPQKIAMYLGRYHDIATNSSGVWRILNKLGMSRLPSSQRYKRHKDRWKRYEKQLPGPRGQVDVMSIDLIPGTREQHYQFTSIDVCTRIRSLRDYPRDGQETPIQFRDYLLEHLSFTVQGIQTDKDAEFQGSFHWHALDRGIGHVYIKPAAPRHDGKVDPPCDPWRLCLRAQMADPLVYRGLLVADARTGRRHNHRSITGGLGR